MSQNPEGSHSTTGKHAIGFLSPLSLCSFRAKAEFGKSAVPALIFAPSTDSLTNPPPHSSPCRFGYQIASAAGGGVTVLKADQDVHSPN